MLLFWISLVVFVLSFCALKWASYYKIGFIFAVLSFVVCTASFAGMVSKETKVEKYTHEHRVCEERIRLYQKDTVSFESLFDLYERCKEVDEIIELNGKNYTSIWIGKGFSKQISELPPLVPQFVEKLDKKDDTKWFYYPEEKPISGKLDYITQIKRNGREIYKVNYWYDGKWAFDDENVIKWFRI